MPNTTPYLLHRIQSEFLEMPGLRLTPAQAQRLWGLDQVTCTEVINTLVDKDFLVKTPDGTVARPGECTVRCRMKW
jgi:Fic family protein